MLKQIFRGDVSDGDIWHRPLTNARYINKATGKLRHAALRFETPEERQPYQTELSGRLRSIVTSIEDVRAEGIKRAEVQRLARQKENQSGKEFEFVGVAHSQVLNIRAWPVDTCDVLYDPRINPKEGDFDLAHANVVFQNKPPNLLSKIDDIITALQVTPPAELSSLPSANCHPPRDYKFWRLFFRFF